ncbi:MAG: hypothetical protein M3338_05995 [Actinomycetota bacterium]|nr:hypothetical protein [Actinomycetota bacterium]
MLDLTFEQNFQLRRTILRNIERDLKSGGFRACHHQLVRDLVEAMGTLPYNKKQGCGHCLSFLFDYAPQDLKDYLLRVFLTSKYIIFRRRAYKKLSWDWDAFYEDAIKDVWDAHHDGDCARLMIDRFDVEYLNDNFFDLASSVEESWHFTKLYLRVSEIDASKFEHLSHIDEITFSYVAAKLGKVFDSETALAMFERNKYDDRIGLLVWCFGQMKLWSVLVSIDQNFDEEAIWREKHHLRMEDLGLSESDPFETLLA